MNNITNKNKIFCLCAILLVAVFVFGCCAKPVDKNTITLETYDKPIALHTQLQQTYLAQEDPSVLDAFVDGKHEYSRPEGAALTWSATEECQQGYTVTISESRTFDNAVTLTADACCVTVYNLKVDTTYYWKVAENKTNGATSKIGMFTTAADGPRNLYIDGVTNVRDMGGWLTVSGLRIKQGLVYRGARLNDSYSNGFDKDKNVRDENCVLTPEITEQGAKVFADLLGIKTEIDLRDTNGNGYPGGGKKENGKVVTVDTAPTTGSVVNIVLNRSDLVDYVAIPMNGSATLADNIPEVKAFFDLLANKENYPVYFHCNIGTNRTGLVAYLLGAVLGMSEQDLLRDYMFSDFGTIALPTPLSSNRARTEVEELYQSLGKIWEECEGATLKDKAEVCLTTKCGVSMDTINAIRAIMLAD